MENRVIGEGVGDTNSTIVSPERSAKPLVEPVVFSKKREKLWKQRLTVPTLVLSDLLLASLFWSLGLVLYDIWGKEPPLVGPTATYILASTVLWVGLRALVGLYPGYGLSLPEELRRQTYATVATLAITTLFAFAFQAGDLLPRLLIGINFLELLLLAPLGRHFVKCGLAKAGLWGKLVVILGAGETGKQLVRTLQKDWGLGFRPVAFFNFRRASQQGEVLEGVPYRGTVADVIELSRKGRIDTVIFAMPHLRGKYLSKYIDEASHCFRHVIVIPKLEQVATSAVIARDLAGTIGIEVKYNLLNPWVWRAKRALDLFGVLVGGLLISPILLTIAVLIKLDSPGPVFYRQSRVGAGGKYFDCWKFRTMHPDAQRLLTELLRRDPDLRAEWERNHKLREDPRITRVGRFLRKSSLDELPQLWNVLRGEMSLVGPRPIVTEEIPKYGTSYELYKRMRPGITGLWQVSGRSDADYEERIVLVAYYVRNWSVWLDLIILARTVRTVIFGRGAI